MLCVAVFIVMLSVVMLNDLVPVCLYVLYCAYIVILSEVMQYVIVLVCHNVSCCSFHCYAE